MSRSESRSGAVLLPADHRKSSKRNVPLAIHGCSPQARANVQNSLGNVSRATTRKVTLDGSYRVATRSVAGSCR